MRTTKSDLVIKGFEFGSQSSTWTKVWSPPKEERRKGYQAVWSVAVKHELAGNEGEEGREPNSSMSYCKNDKYIGGHFTIKPGKKGEDGRIIVTEDSNCDYRSGRDDEVIGRGKVPAKKNKFLKEFWSGNGGDDDWSDGASLDNYGLLSFNVNVYRDSIRTGGSASSKASFKYYLNISAKNPDVGFPDLTVMVKPKWMKSSSLTGNPIAPMFEDRDKSVSRFEDEVTPQIDSFWRFSLQNPLMDNLL